MSPRKRKSPNFSSGLPLIRGGRDASLGKVEPPKAEPRVKGLTLVEIIVVLVILAIAAALVAPYALSTSDVQATAAARMIATDLQYAQNVAITTQTSTTITFDPAGESYTLSNASGPLIHPMTKSAYTVTFSADNGFGQLDLVSASFNGNPVVVFDELGGPGNSGTVTVQAGQYVYEVDVAPATGKVTVAASGS